MSNIEHNLYENPENNINKNQESSQRLNNQKNETRTPEKENEKKPQTNNESNIDEDLEYEQIKNSRFKQQRLPAWRPVPTILSIMTLIFNQYDL